MNLLERTLRKLRLIGPQRRGQAFSGAAVNRLTLDWITRPVSSDADIYNNLTTLRARARDLRRNNPLIRQYAALLADNVIGPDGPKLQAQVRLPSGDLDRPTNDAIEGAWSQWGRQATVDGRLNMAALQRLLLTQVAIDGEIFVRPVYNEEFGFALQIIDPDQVDETYNQAAEQGRNEIRLGVEVNVWGRPVAYHVFRRHRSDISYSARETARERIPAGEILHLFDPLRANQTRGVSWLAPVMMTLKMLDGYMEAEVVAARSGAAKMGFLRPSPESYSVPETQDGQPPVFKLDASPGTIETLPPGYDFQDWNPAHPNAQLAEFVKTCLRYVSSGLPCSYNALANDLEGVNYSSIRSGVLVERDHWRALQAWWISGFLTPVYERWLEYAALAGAVRLPGRNWRAFSAARWSPRGWAWVDPLKDVQAAILAINNGLESRTEAVNERGGDLEDVFEALAEEQALAEEYGVPLAGPAEAPAPQPEGEDKENADGAGPPANDGRVASTWEVVQ